MKKTKRKSTIIRRRRKADYQVLKLGNPLFPAKELPKVSFKNVILAGILSFLVFAVYIFITSPIFHIQKIEISGLNNQKDEVIRAYVNNQANQKFFGFLPQSHLLFFNQKSFIKSLDQTGDFENINITKEPPDTLKIKLTERTHYIIWLTNSAGYRLDFNGQVFKKNDLLDNSGAETNANINRLVVRVFSDKDFNIGDTLLKTEEINFLIELNRQLFSQDIFRVKYYLIPSMASNDIYIVTQAGWEIRLNMTKNLSNQLQYLFTALESIVDKNSLNYIDVRIDGKIFYK